MFKRIITILIVICLHFPSHSQAIGIGESLPDISSNEVINWPSNTFQFSKLKGKAVIVVFWSPWCISCIRDFPKLDSLQNQFKEKLQFVLVTWPDKDSIERFFLAKKRVRKPNIPIICADNLLRNLLPHEGNPFYVWISKEGIVEHFEGGQYTKEEYIKKFLKGEETNIEDLIPVIPSIPFVSDEWKDFTEYYSSVTRYNSYARPEIERKPGFTGIRSDEFPVTKLYQQAMDGLTNNKYQFYRPGRIILEANEPAKYIYPAKFEDIASWRKNYCFNYELYLPVSKKDKMYDIMKRDLDLYFDLQASIEKRLVKCYVLKRTSSIDKIRSKGWIKKDTFFPTKINSSTFDSIRLYQNGSYSLFSFKLQGFAEETLRAPFVDATNYSGNIDIQFRGISLDPFNLSLLREDLKKYDLDIVEENYYLDVLLLKEKNNW